MTCFISLRTQYENLGDEVINSLLIRELARRDRVVALASGVPSWYIANVRHNLGGGAIDIIDDTNIFNIRLLRTLVKEEGYLFTSCGDVTEVGNGSRRDLAIRMLHVFPGFILSQLGASMARVSKRRAGIFRRALSRKQSISVRDSASLQVLKTAGVSAGLVPDLAFLLDPVTHLGQRKRIILSFRARDHEEEAAIETTIATLLPMLAGNWEVMTTAQVEHDILLNRQLAERHGLAYVSLLEPGEGRLARAFDLYDGAEIILSNRLHVLLIAASRGSFPVPMLMPSETKVRGVMGDAGIEVIDFGDGSSEKVASVVSDSLLGSGRIAGIYRSAATDIRSWLDSLVGPAMDLQ